MNQCYKNVLFTIDSANNISILPLIYNYIHINIHMQAWAASLPSRRFNLAIFYLFITFFYGWASNNYVWWCKGERSGSTQTRYNRRVGLTVDFHRHNLGQLKLPSLSKDLDKLICQTSHLQNTFFKIMVKWCGKKNWQFKIFVISTLLRFLFRNANFNQYNQMSSTCD